MDKCINMPILGQKIHAGMTYDYGDNRFFPADPSFKRTKLETVTLNGPVLVEVINLQSLQQIANSMNLEGIFKLNILHELINDQCQHPLLNDNHESIRVIKAAIRLNLITRTDKLNIEHITTIAKKVQYDTWVVTELQQGIESFIVLEKKLATGDNIEQSLQELLDVAKKISKGQETASDLEGLSVKVRGDIGHFALTTGSKSIFERSFQQTTKELARLKSVMLRFIKNFNDPSSEELARPNEKVEQACGELLDVARKISKGYETPSDLKGLSVEVRGDIGHYDSSTLTTGSISILEKSSELLQNNRGVATPKLAVLQWIKISTDPAPQKVAIVDADMQQVENILRCFDEFRDLKWRLAALVSSAACKRFKWIQQDLRKISDLLNQEQKRLTEQVLDATKKHRKFFPDKFDIGEIVCHYEQKVPSSWLSKKEQEIKILNGWLKMLSTVEFCSSFGSVEEKFGDCSSLYSLEINIAAVQDPFISDLLSAAIDPVDISEKKWWFDLETEKHLFKLIRNFVDFAENFKSDVTKKFVFACFQKESCRDKIIECVCYQNREPRRFFPPAAPQLLKVEDTTAKSVKLSWEMPELDQGITHFLCAYRLRGPDSDATKWNETRTSGPVRNMTLRNLRSDCAYEFKVAGVSDVGSSKYVELQGAVQTLIAETTIPEKDDAPLLHSDSGKLLLDLIMQESVQITTTDPKIYQVKGEQVFSDDRNKINRYVYGQKSAVIPKEKVILILGITGGGKSTLIDAIFNFLCGVKFKDDLRLKLTPSVKKQQAQSVTDSVDIYTIYYPADDCVQYVLTVIDTPGFLDTTDLERDAQLQEQLHQLFSNSDSGGIDHIDAVGIVTASSDSRFTVIQKYIFNCVTSVFAKDIVDNIFILCTFADEKKPEVLEVISAASLPCRGYFVFNNCTLFTEKTYSTSSTLQYWEKAQKGISDFLEKLHDIEPKSISLTKVVLEERFRLEECLDGLLLQIQFGIGKMQEIRQTETFLQSRRAEIDDNKNFEVTVNVPQTIHDNVSFVVRLLRGSPLNCKECGMTCGLEKFYWKDRFENCSVCPAKCKWEKHERQAYRATVTMRKVTQTIEEMKLKYGVAVGEADQADRFLEALKKLRDITDGTVTSYIKDMHRIIMRLNEIALRPNVNSSPEFVKLLIQSEEQEHQSGYQERIKALRIVKKRAAMLESIIDGTCKDLASGEAFCEDAGIESVTGDKKESLKKGQPVSTMDIKYEEYTKF